MWAVVVFHVALWGQVTELGYLAKTDDFAQCAYFNTLAIQANESLGLDPDVFIFCKQVEQ